MIPIFYEYPPCSTCKKAKKALELANIDFTAIHIVKQAPSATQLQEWITKYEIEVNKLFNTSGNVYKELHLKNRLSSLSTIEKCTLLASNGMLIKRPLLIGKDYILIGFKEEQYRNLK